MTTTADVAVRNGHGPAQPSTALAIKNGQTTWDDKQRAALVAMGVSDKATPAELAVFFHQCRNTQLDPFLKQIYFIHRRVKEGDRWVEKPSTQIGIDGFRIIRDRIADRKGLRVEYEDTIWYDADRNAYDVWVWDEPATACKVTVLVDGRRFPAVLRFNEYCQRNRDGDRLGRWRDGHAHQIEKCAEADALRKAFPNDMSGLVLEDAAPLSDPDAPDRLPQDRPRVTAEQIRDRRPAAPQNAAVRPGHPDYVDAEIVDDADVPPAVPHTPQGAAPAAPAPAGGTSKVRADMLTEIGARFGELGVDDSSDRLLLAAQIARLDDVPGSLGKLSPISKAKVHDALSRCRSLDELNALIRDGEAPDGQ